jgi:hypothetical protein
MDAAAESSVDTHTSQDVPRFTFYLFLHCFIFNVFSSQSPPPVIRRRRVPPPTAASILQQQRHSIANNQRTFVFASLTCFIVVFLILHTFSALSSVIDDSPDVVRFVVIIII